MSKEEFEAKKHELEQKIMAANTQEDLDKLKIEIQELKTTKDQTQEEKSKEEDKVAKEEVKEENEEAKTEDEKISVEEERSLLLGSINKIQTRDLVNAKEVKNIREERSMEQKELLQIEERGKDLKEGKVIKVPYENRSVTVSSGDLLVHKQYKDTIDESFNQVSGLVDKVNTINLKGGDSYSVPFEVNYKEGAYTNEAGEYTEVEPTVDYVETGRAKITAYTEITKEAMKLPNANYQALVIKRVKDAIRKKIGEQAIIGAGTANTIKGIYNADTKVLPTETATTADIELNTIDADTLNTIVFTYGGDESVEAEQTLILSKSDLEAFSKIKTTDGKFVYKITRKGQEGTIAYADGGLEVGYIINSACNSLSKADTTAGKYTMIYGSLNSYEMPVFSELTIEESRDYKFKQGIIAYRGDVIIGGTVAKYNGFVRVKKATPAV